MKILVVDDSDFFRTTLKRHLSSVPNLEIDDAANGIEALDKHRTFAPDIILMDITMPHLDGLAALKIIKAIDTTVKIIMISAVAGQQYIIDECNKARAEAILTKPVTRENLLTILERVGGLRMVI